MDRVSRGLIALGLASGDRVALISHNNRCEWNLMDHGTLQAGGIDVPIYPTMTPEDYVYILNHSESRSASSPTPNCTRRSSPSRTRSPASRRSSPSRRWTAPPLERGHRGRPRSPDHEELQARRDAVSDTDMATIIYTSGTTGKPKGVMLTHRNIAQNALNSIPRLPEREAGTDYRVLSFLPVCHIFERMLHYLYMH